MSVTHKITIGCKMYCMVNAVFYPYTHSFIPNIITK